MVVAALLTAAVLSAEPQAPRRVYVGVYLSDVSDFDLRAGRFKADLRVWLKWLGDDTPPGITYENGEIDSLQELGTESDGRWHSVRWRVQGTFRGEFPVHAFPFDRQTLPVVVALDGPSGELVPDLGASGMSPAFSVTGWFYEPYFNARRETKRYGSDLGSVRAEGKAAKLERAAFTVEMRRPFAPYLLKFALPLVLILLIALLALWIPPEKLDVRSAMGVTALLACIAFHYTQADTLPDVSYLVAADKLFLGAYLFISATMVITVLSFREHTPRPDLSRLVDQLGKTGLPAIAFLGTVVLMATALEQPEPPAVEVVARASQPVLRLGVPALDTVQAGGLPPRRGQLVMRGASGAMIASVAEEAPAMTNPLVRLLPDGGMRVRWRLARGAAFSNGRTVTVDDMMFSIASSPNPQRTNVEAVDARTVDVTYSTRHSEWLNGFGLFPKEALETAWLDGGRDALVKASNGAKTPTAGPYELTEFKPGVSATMVRNASYAGPKPVFERIEVVVLADPVRAAEALLGREVDVLPSVSGATIEKLKGQESVRVLEQPGDLLWVLMPKLDQPPWNTLEARRALLAALDRSAMAKALEPAPAKVAWGWRAAAPPGRFLGPSLKSLGLDGQTVQLHVSPLKVKTSANALLAQAVVDDLTRAGLTVEVVEHQELNALMQKRDFDGLVLTGRDTSDPARFLNVAYESGRYLVEKPEGEHYDAEMVETYERRGATLYDERRGALDEKLQAEWLERLPMLPLVLTSRLAAVRADLDGPQWGVADSLWWNLPDWKVKVAEPAAPPAARR